jgi:hypothetical protein
MIKQSIFKVQHFERRVNEPRPIGDILSEMLRSNLFLATGYRKWKHGEETSLETIKKLSYGS